MSTERKVIRVHIRYCLGCDNTGLVCDNCECSKTDCRCKRPRFSACECAPSRTKNRGLRLVSTTAAEARGGSR